MRKNIGFQDKILRISFALMLLILVFNKTIAAPESVFFFLLSMFLISTSAKGVCPLYRLFKLNSRKNLNDKASNFERNQTLLNNYLKNYNEGYPGIKKNAK